MSATGLVRLDRLEFLMNVLHRRARLLSTLLGFALLFGMACKRPETAVREHPVQGVELVQMVEGMTLEEERALLTRLAEGLGVPSESAGSGAVPRRWFRLTLKGKPDPSEGWGLGKTWAATTGGGLLVGAVVVLSPGAVFASWKVVAIGAGVGGLVGFAYGPSEFQKRTDLKRELGYLPWSFQADWQVLERRPDLGEDLVASSQALAAYFSRATPHLDLKPHLKPLSPDSRSPADIRRASLEAYIEALLLHFRKKG